METVTAEVDLCVPVELLPRDGNAPHALIAILTGALAEFRIKVSRVQFVLPGPEIDPWEERRFK